VETQPPNLCKHDASIANLSLFRLNQHTSLTLKDSVIDTVQVDEFFWTGSLQTLDAYFTLLKAFSKEWMDLQAFLEKVHFF
jgi:hypothetical protein